MTEGWLTLLQFADGLFPAGGFAHSFGLETYVQDGLVTERAGLEEFVAAHLEGSAGPADAVAVAAAVRLAGGRRRRRVGRARRAAGRDEGRARAARGEPADGTADAARGGGARVATRFWPRSSGPPATA